VFVLFEIGARLYWAFGHGVPLTAESEDWYSRYFPGLRDSQITETEFGDDDGHFDVLLLGGSVLDNLHTNHAETFRTALSEAVGQPVRLYDLAYPAHTMRDSLLKHRLVRDRAVDLVVVYHAINDTRMNNSSEEMFRDDYTHAAWYYEISRMEAHAGLLPYLVLPFTLEHVMIQFLGAMWFEFYVQRDGPNEAMTRFGGTLKTPKAFAANLEEIVSETGKSKTPLLVMTFDWYEADNYSLEAFQAGTLDYDLHSHATEIWGKPSHIAAGVRAHNDILRSYAQVAPDHVIYLDVEPVVPDGRAYWNDICHFNDAGERLWLDAMVGAVKAATR
jgi:hypothetical protein